MPCAFFFYFCKGASLCFSQKKPETGGPLDFLIVGLGNPGKKYEGTRHNAGFIALEALAEKLDVRVNRVKFKAYVGEAAIGDRRVLLLMPQTFMNLSGEAVTEAMRCYKLPPEKVLVMLDDITQPVGMPCACGAREATAASGECAASSLCQAASNSPHPESAWAPSPIRLRPEGLGAVPIHRGGRGKDETTRRTAADAACLIAQDRMDEAMNHFFQNNRHSPFGRICVCRPLSVSAVNRRTALVYMG